MAICAGGSVNLLESESAEDCAELVVARAAVFHSFSARENNSPFAVYEVKSFAWKYNA